MHVCMYVYMDAADTYIHTYIHIHSTLHSIYNTHSTHIYFSFFSTNTSIYLFNFISKVILYEIIIKFILLFSILYNTHAYAHAYIRNTNKCRIQIMYRHMIWSLGNAELSLMLAALCAMRRIVDVLLYITLWLIHLHTYIMPTKRKEKSNTNYVWKWIVILIFALRKDLSCSHEHLWIARKNRYM